MVSVALVVKMIAKDETKNEVAEFLSGAVELANAEEGTPVWFALRTDDHTFWIVDAFPGDTQRQAHLNGLIAAALMANAERLLASPPEIHNCRRPRVEGGRLSTGPPGARRDSEDPLS